MISNVTISVNLFFTFHTSSTYINKKTENIMAIRIYVDQGHGPSVNAGAMGFGLYEQNITYMVGAYLADILRLDGRFEVLTSRNSISQNVGFNTNSSLRERVEQANEWPADYFISIHCNANTNPAINGTEGYVYSLDSPAYGLAKNIVDEIVRRTGTKNNGVIERPTLYVLRFTKMTSTLIELAYISNFNDSVKLANDQYQFAFAIYEGLLNYLNLPLSETVISSLSNIPV